MQIILLSGGSGSRLWPLSNDTRSKQFLKVLPREGHLEPESMIQRVVRQIEESGLDAKITVATALSQRDSVTTQLGNKIDLVTEPSRRHTFPAIALACEYLNKIKKCSEDETVIVMPCDPFTVDTYYETLKEIDKSIKEGYFKLTLMGITPTYPSSKYGYILPSKEPNSEIKLKTECKAVPVKEFKEKPSVEKAKELISEGALWNAGVFGFKLGYMLEQSRKYVNYENYEQVLEHFEDYPETSFDYEIAEKETSEGVVGFHGFWKDLGTWNTLTDELTEKNFGNVITDGTSDNTHIFNELTIPLLCIGTQDLVIAASPDGIIVSEKRKSENVKEYASQLKHRPMYEERRWGTYKVVDYVEFPDKFHALTKQLTLNPGSCISYQKHSCRDEVWTFIDGEGEIVLDGVIKPVKRGDIINIPKGQKHALRAKTSLTFIEVQHGSNLIEEDIERYPWDWKDS